MSTSTPQASHVEMRGAEAGDGVDDEQRLGLFVLEEFGDAFDVVADAGGGLGGLDEDGASLELERGFDLIEREGLAVGHLDDIGVAAEGFDQRGPALAELAGGEDEDAVAGRGEVGDGGLHGAGAAARQDDDVVGGADEVLELREHAGVQGRGTRGCGGECQAAAMANWAAGSSGVGPGVKRRVLRIMGLL